VAVLARTQLAPRQWICLVRCGRRILVVGLSGDSVTTLSEITDGEEVVEVLGLCEETRPDSASSTFRRIFRNEAREMSDELAEFDDPGRQAPSVQETGSPTLSKVRTELASLMEKIHGWKQS